jgi:NAD-dependent dihydropyrimidine dehydrogenase PreA subunit
MGPKEATRAAGQPGVEKKRAASSYFPPAGFTDKITGFNVEIFTYLENQTLMAYVIAEPCIGTKDSACVDACPVDCIHPKKDEPGFEAAEQLYIDPVECIDCGACVPVCPVSAIFALDDLPEKWKAYTEKNAKHFGR